MRDEGTERVPGGQSPTVLPSCPPPPSPTPNTLILGVFPPPEEGHSPGQKPEHDPAITMAWELPPGDKDKGCLSCSHCFADALQSQRPPKAHASCFCPSASVNPDVCAAILTASSVLLSASRAETTPAMVPPKGCSEWAPEATNRQWAGLSWLLPSSVKAQIW